jgi:hypothetical protein
MTELPACFVRYLFGMVRWRAGRVSAPAFSVAASDAAGCNRLQQDATYAFFRPPMICRKHLKGNG